MANPLISVIVAAYNADHFLPETLATLLDQTVDEVEILVVDDGSTDSTADICKAMAPRVTYFYQENSGGCASPRNHGIRHAKGDYITFFDADDLMAPEKLQRQLQVMQAHPEVGMVVSDYRNFDETGRTQPSHFSSCPLLSDRLAANNADAPLILQPDECTSLLLEENFCIASSAMYRADLVRHIGGFDESLTSCEDYHFYFRIARLAPTAVIPYEGFQRRLHSASMSANNRRMLQNYIASRSKLLHTESNPSNQQRLRERIAGYRLSLARLEIEAGHRATAFKQLLSMLPHLPKAFYSDYFRLLAKGFLQWKPMPVQR